MRDIAEQIKKLRRLTVTELIERYEEAFGRPPRVKHREWLWKRIAWKIQEQRHGGLSETARNRLEELIAELDLPIDERQRTVSGRLRDRTHAKAPKAGTVFTRMWHGREVRAVAVEGGFECEGVLYRSLSAVARAVTKSRWNGKLFFNLTKRRRRT